jgi:signal transduction histidine kinase
MGAPLEAAASHLNELKMTAEPVLTRTRAAWIASLAFVLLTLAALVYIPIAVQKRVDGNRTAIESSEPARTLLMSLQFNLVREMSTLNQFALTGDTTSATAFRIARIAEREIWNDLAPLAKGLGTDVHEQFVEARTIAEQWHERLNEEELLRLGQSGLEVLQTPDVGMRFEQVLKQTAQLDSVIIQMTAERRASIAAAERRGLRLTLVSGGLAFLAAIVVASLVWRLRRLAAESEQRRQEIAKALADSAREAEARQRLLRGITHDVKNPLGAARGYAELLNMQIKGPLSAEQQAMVAGVERSIDGALAIISDLLDLARADSGGITVHRINVDINDMVRQAVEDHRAAAEAAGLEITLELCADTLDLYTDPVRVRQVLDNVISNAIKYTPAPGNIVVRTDPNAEDAPFAVRAAAIRVSDTGPGIPDDLRETIFDEFTRIEDGGTMKGHGLGLAIARRIARLLGGEIGVVSDDSPGATFTLWLPQREQRKVER